MALLIVLMIVATMAALATVMQEHWLQSFSRSRVLHSRMTDKWAVLGAEAVIRHHYAQALSAPVLRPASVGKMTWLKLDGLVFNVAVRDLQACFNLNALFGNDKKTAKRNSVATGENTGSEQQEDAAKEPEKDYAQQVFIRLLVNSGSEEEQAKSVLAAIMENSRLSGRKFADISELRIAKTISRHQWRNLAKMLCVLPDSRLKISVNGLQEEHFPLISALLDIPFSKEAMTRWIAARPQQGWSSLKALKMAGLPEGSADALEKIKEHLTFGSEYFELRLEQRKTQSLPLRSWLSRTGSDFTVIRRQYGLSE